MFVLSALDILVSSSFLCLSVNVGFKDCPPWLCVKTRLRLLNYLMNRKNEFKIHVCCYWKTLGYSAKSTRKRVHGKRNAALMWEEASVLLHHAFVHNNHNTRVLCQCCCFFIDYSQLHPDHVRNATLFS